MLSMNLVWGMEWVHYLRTQKKRKEKVAGPGPGRESPAYQEMPHFEPAVLLQVDDPRLVLFSHVAMIRMLGS